MFTFSFKKSSISCYMYLKLLSKTIKLDRKAIMENYLRFEKLIFFKKIIEDIGNIN